MAAGIFLHISALERASLDCLTDGQQVSYELVQARGREFVANLALIE